MLIAKKINIFNYNNQVPINYLNFFNYLIHLKTFVKIVFLHRYLRLA